MSQLYSAREALETIDRYQPDVVLLDIGLPEIDGYEVARRIRLLPAQASTRIVALTGYGQAEDRERARSAGFDAYLVKPIDLPALKRAIAAARP